MPISNGRWSKRQQLDPAMTGATPAQRVAAQAYSPNGQAAPCIPGQPCNPMPTYGYAQQGSGQAQLSPAEQASQQLAAKERERSYESRFSSNLAYTRQPDAAKYTSSPERINRLRLYSCKHDRGEHNRLAV